MDPELL